MRVLVHVVKLLEPVFQEVHIGSFCPPQGSYCPPQDSYCPPQGSFCPPQGERLCQEKGLRVANPHTASSIHQVGTVWTVFSYRQNRRNVLDNTLLFRYLGTCFNPSTLEAYVVSDYVAGCTLLEIQRTAQIRFKLVVLSLNDVIHLP